MQAEPGTRLRPAAIPASGISTPALGRATDRLLEAAAGRASLPQALANAAVGEIADWCAVDLLRGDGRLHRAASARSEDIEFGVLRGALARYAIPDPGLLLRVEAAQGPIRIEEPEWIPKHRAIASPITDRRTIHGLLLTLVPLNGREVADDLHFTAALGERFAQIIEASSNRPNLGGKDVAELGRESGHSPLSRLRRAFSEGKLRLELEPIASTVTAEMAGAKAVVAWPSPDPGDLRPGAFRGLEGDAELARGISAWARLEAFGAAAELAIRGLDLAISVELTAADLELPGIGARIEREAAESRARPEGIIVEISAAVARESAHRGARELERLHAAGFRIAMADFGSTAEAPAKLIDLPLDVFKLSAGLVADCDRDSARAARLGAIAQLGRDLGLDLVATGVASDAELAHVTELGCRWAQGFAIGAPCEIGELIERAGAARRQVI